MRCARQADSVFKDFLVLFLQKLHWAFQRTTSAQQCRLFEKKEDFYGMLREKSSFYSKADNDCDLCSKRQSSEI